MIIRRRIPNFKNYTNSKKIKEEVTKELLEMYLAKEE
jgi:hypothetical protein